MTQTPYIGITGFTHAREVEHFFSHASLLGSPIRFTNRKIMIGVLASSKTLAGKINRWPQRYPPVENIHSIFGCRSEVINLIHYSTDNPAVVYEDLVSITEIGGPYVDGVQLNMTWPASDAIARYRVYLENSSKRLRDKPIRIVLQIGKKALAEANYDPTSITEMLATYVQKRAITDILLDASGGSGTLFDPVIAQSTLQAIQGRFPNIGIGVAGGLWEQTLQVLKPLAQDFPFLNLDAEGKLRDPISDTFDCNKAVQYYEAALKMFLQTDHHVTN